ncbi:MAG: DUF1576 domain-containing protein [Peptostreptococcales bacterium]
MKDSTKFILLVKRKKTEFVVLFYILAVLITGLSLQSFDELIRGMINIFKIPGNLITDYMVIAGIGPAFVNAALVALIGYILLIINKVPFTGRAIAAIFTMMGFALMGKNVWSILPIIAGVYIYGQLTRHKFGDIIYFALFGTALAPLVTQSAFVFGWGIIGGIIIGILAGMIMAPVGAHVLAFHEGYNLYNVGLAAGFIGLVFFNILRTYGYDCVTTAIWGTEFDREIKLFSIIFFASMILMGILIDKNGIKNYHKILKEPGTLVTDFVNISGLGTTLINMGLVGFVGVAYIALIGGNFNGPTLCGLMTMMGFGSFGKHPFNIIPIMVGVWLATFFSIYEHNSPGPLLAGLFGTTLAPLSGRFGPLVGILAGYAHLSIVSFIGVVHGGLNLYNNGLAAGFVAAFFIAIVKGTKKDTSQMKAEYKEVKSKYRTVLTKYKIVKDKSKAIKANQVGDN